MVIIVVRVAVIGQVTLEKKGKGWLQTKEAELDLEAVWKKGGQFVDADQ